MEETENNGHPSADRQHNTFKQHYAGTFIAKRYYGYNNPIGQAQDTTYPQGEPLPMEFKALLEWMRDSKNHEPVTAVFTIGIFVATAIYAVFAIFQWCAMGESNRINRTALESVQRPFIFVSQMNSQRFLEPLPSQKVSSVELSFIWRNSGTTPAKYLRARVSHTFTPGDEPLPKDFSFPDYEKTDTRMFISPQGAATYFAATLTAKDADEIFRKQESAYFWGWAKYNDIFPGTREHIVEFCTKLTGFANDPQIADAPPLTRNCERHNCFDEECTTNP